MDTSPAAYAAQIAAEAAACDEGALVRLMTYCGRRNYLPGTKAAEIAAAEIAAVSSEYKRRGMKLPSFAL